MQNVYKVKIKKKARKKRSRKPQQNSKVGNPIL